ncbi:hypothetical protein FISHEDRAFT_56247 [Fistulina hepatica ATCC 64428]|uniref:Transmembrane protein n=1 Tax=Fistulina hepatica ATCC 64428 TaxID=1128425 RepID=A0A0D7AJH0_9AGAR|nr:hypothetical protein FISHEDRAFT_56247 [Fistulina hepatica ATCC 64428]
MSSSVAPASRQASINVADVAKRSARPLAPRTFFITFLAFLMGVIGILCSVFGFGHRWMKPPQKRADIDERWVRVIVRPRQSPEATSGPSTAAAEPQRDELKLKIRRRLFAPFTRPLELMPINMPAKKTPDRHVSFMETREVASQSVALLLDMDTVSRSSSDSGSSQMSVTEGEHLDAPVSANTRRGSKLAKLKIGKKHKSSSSSSGEPEKTNHRGSLSFVKPNSWLPWTRSNTVFDSPTALEPPEGSRPSTPQSSGTPSHSRAATPAPSRPPSPSHSRHSSSPIRSMPPPTIKPPTPPPTPPLPSSKTPHSRTIPVFLPSSKKQKHQSTPVARTQPYAYPHFAAPPVPRPVVAPLVPHRAPDASTAISPRPVRVERPSVHLAEHPGGAPMARSATVTAVIRSTRPSLERGVTVSSSTRSASVDGHVGCRTALVERPPATVLPVPGRRRVSFDEGAMTQDGPNASAPRQARVERPATLYPVSVHSSIVQPVALPTARNAHCVVVSRSAVPPQEASIACNGNIYPLLSLVFLCSPLGYGFLGCFSLHDFMAWHNRRVLVIAYALSGMSGPLRFSAIPSLVHCQPASLKLG